MKRLLIALITTLLTQYTFAADVPPCSYMNCAFMKKIAVEGDNAVVANQGSTTVETQVSQTQENVVENQALAISKVPDAKATEMIYESSDDPRVYYIVERKGTKAAAAMKAKLKSELPADEFTKIHWNTAQAVKLVYKDNPVAGSFSITTVDFNDINTSSYQAVMDIIDG